eukprot:5745298-Pyramimonas_sp.AAC.1
MIALDVDHCPVCTYALCLAECTYGGCAVLYHRTTVPPYLTISHRTTVPVCCECDASVAAAQVTDPAQSGQLAEPAFVAAMHL